MIKTYLSPLEPGSFLSVLVSGEDFPGGRTRALLDTWPIWTVRPWKSPIVLIPSGKHTKNYGKSPFFMGKYTIYKWSFSIAMLNYQRVTNLPNPMNGRVWILGEGQVQGEIFRRYFSPCLFSLSFCWLFMFLTRFTRSLEKKRQGSSLAVGWLVFLATFTAWTYLDGVGQNTTTWLLYALWPFNVAMENHHF